MTARISLALGVVLLLVAAVGATALDDVDRDLASSPRKWTKSFGKGHTFSAVVAMFGFIGP